MADTWGLLQRRVRANGGAPFVTHVDAATGARTELSATSVANAAAKIANALRQEFDLDRDDLVVLDLPVHWQRTTWCAGIWTAGCAISLTPHPRARLIVTSEMTDDARRTTFTAASPAAPLVAASLHPFGLPIAEPLPVGVDDVTVIVRQQPDAYLFEPPDGSAAAYLAETAQLTQDEVLSHATALAHDWGLVTGGRLLVDGSLPDWPGLAATFAVPLVADGAVVLLSGADDPARATVEGTEHVTAVAR